MTVLVVILTIAAGFWLFQLWRKRQRQTQLLATPLSDAHSAIVKENVPIYSRVPTPLRSRLDGKINLFLDQVKFFGFDGVEVTDEIRLTIAAQACLLVANKDSWYKNLRTILIYPTAFKSQQAESDGYVITTREITRIGESWSRGPVVLSWAHAAQGAFIDTDGHNVVFHEFAHQLDDLSGATDGFPLLRRGQKEGRWLNVFRDAYSRLRDDAAAGRRSFLDPYGATAPAEFFAVAVEAFFEKPEAFKRKEPALYGEFEAYFAVSPDDWR